MEHPSHDILDHGYLRLVETWGSDERIVEAARMSTGKGFLGWGSGHCKLCGISPEDAIDRGLAGDQCPDGSDHVWDVGDAKLLKYLWERQHWTPFEMAGLTIEVQAPIFLFREWHRHRVPFGYNEASARYAPLPEIDYVPTVARLMRGGGHLTKQAGLAAGAQELTEKIASEDLEALREYYKTGQALYDRFLAHGWPKELARLPVTVGRYSKMRATGNLRGWLALLTLRGAPAAQWEFQEYSAVLGRRVISQAFPRVWSLFLAGMPSFAREGL